MTKVLIVEDELVIRKGIRAILERAFGGEVVFLEAEDGLDAIDIYTEELPSIVITDVQMPECDGLEMIERINAQSSRPPEFLVISGHNEFAYAKRAIRLGVLDYLLKPVDKAELIKTVKMLIERNDSKQEENKKHLRDSMKLKEATRHLCEQELCRLLHKNSAKVLSRVKAELLAWDIHLNDAMYICVTADYMGSEKDALMQFSLENICRETLDSISQRTILFFDAQGRMVFLIPGEEVLQLRMLASKAAVKCLDNLKRYLSLKCFFGIGKPVCLAENIFESYLQALDGLRYKIIDAEMGIMEYERLKPGEEVKSRIDWRKLFELLMERGAGSAYNAMMEGVDSEPCIAYVNMLERRQSELQKQFAAYLPMSTDNPDIRPFEKHWSLMQWRNSIMEYLETVRTHCLEGNKTAPPKKVSMEILDYIKEHATEDLTLSSVAEQFGYNPSYISTLIKKEFHKNFSTYLAELRIAQAKDLLEKTFLTIKEVAERVGYNDASYFSQVFKKETGISPQEFRNS